MRLAIKEPRELASFDRNRLDEFVLIPPKGPSCPPSPASLAYYT
jgi:hypothetical protein